MAAASASHALNLSWITGVLMMEGENWYKFKIDCLFGSDKDYDNPMPNNIMQKEFKHGIKHIANNLNELNKKKTKFQQKLLLCQEGTMGNTELV